RLGHRREPGDIREHHRDLLALAFDGGLRRQDLVGEMPRRVRGRRRGPRRWGELGRRRRRGGRRRGRAFAETRATLPTELVRRRIDGLAGGTGDDQPPAPLAPAFLRRRIILLPLPPTPATPSLPFP